MDSQEREAIAAHHAGERLRINPRTVGPCDICGRPGDPRLFGEYSTGEGKEFRWLRVCRECHDGTTEATAEFCEFCGDGPTCVVCDRGIELMTVQPYPAGWPVGVETWADLGENGAG